MAQVITPEMGRIERVVPVQTRTERPTSFDPADFGAPTGREPNFRYTPVQRLAPLFEAAERSGAPALEIDLDPIRAAGCLQEDAAERDRVRGEIFRPEDLASALAYAEPDVDLHVRIPAGAALEEPLVVRTTAAAGAAAGRSHLVLEAMPGSAATLVLEHAGDGALAENVEILVREGANLVVVTLQEWQDEAIHSSAHQAMVERDGSLRHVIVSLGGGVVRVNPSVRLAGTGSEGELYGLSFSDAGQHLESQVFLHHEGERTRGDVLYKGALQGAGARSVWIGDVLIGQDATGTDSYEKNQNLMLTEGCRADSVPNLEIETGDIEGAGHASATGRFDDEQLFYLMARGIPERLARRLVVRGFLTEMLQKIPVTSLRDRLEAALEAELDRSASAAADA